MIVGSSRCAASRKYTPAPFMLLNLELSRHSLGSWCFTPPLCVSSCAPYTYVAVIEVSVSMSHAPFPAARFPSVVAMCSFIVTAVYARGREAVMNCAISGSHASEATEPLTDRH